MRVSARLSPGPVLSESRRQRRREGGTELKVMTTEMLSVLQNRDSYVFYPLIFAGSQINQFTSWEFVAGDLVSAPLQFIVDI